MKSYKPNEITWWGNIKKVNGDGGCGGYDTSELDWAVEETDCYENEVSLTGNFHTCKW